MLPRTCSFTSYTFLEPTPFDCTVTMKKNGLMTKYVPVSLKKEKKTRNSITFLCHPLNTVPLDLSRLNT